MKNNDNHLILYTFLINTLILLRVRVVDMISQEKKNGNRFVIQNTFTINAQQGLALCVWERICRNILSDVCSFIFSILN